MSFVTGVVLAAGSSRRLGTPKQLLPLGGRTLLDATLDTARRCDFDQLIVTLGASLAQVRATVDLHDVQVVEAGAHGEGCSQSIGAAVGAVDARAAGIVLLLGDQPGVAPESVRAVVDRGGPITVGRYDDGIGHPFWFGRATFADLGDMHGDKAVWKLIESGRHPVAQVPIAGLVPLDVDTWEDYERLVGGWAE